MTEQELLTEENRKRILSLRLFDDDFMNACFDDYIEGVQLVVRIILGRDDFQVVRVKTQSLLKNLQGRDICLDIHAKSDSGEEFDVEIQRDDRGANYKRARYNSSILDAHLLNPADDINKLPDTYVIFITENDVIGDNEPIYAIDRRITRSGKPFPDGSHIIYVNGSAKDSSTALGRLMHDFSCTKADNMYYPELAKRVRFFKETEEGERAMNSVLEEWKEELTKETAERCSIEFATNLITKQVLSFEEIADITGLPLEKVQELASKETA